MSLRVITDSTADLSPDLIKRFNIGVVPLSVILGDQVLSDTPELRGEAFYAKMRESGAFPKTAQPTPADFINVFKPLLDAGHEIIYVGLSSGLSGTMESARLAAEELKSAGRIRIIDSLNLSMGIGLLACRAAELAAQGLSVDEVAARVGAMVPRVRVAFIVHSLEFLYKGGRLNVAQAVLGALLNIHPMIGVSGGKMAVAEKVRGRWDRALERMLEVQIGSPEKVEPIRISVTHSASPAEDVDFLCREIRKAVPEAEVVVTEAGAVISSHCGPGTIGVLYIEKE